jgi:hypothetical protein
MFSVIHVFARSSFLLGRRRSNLTVSVQLSGFSSQYTLTPPDCHVVRLRRTPRNDIKNFPLGKRGHSEISNICRGAVSAPEGEGTSPLRNIHSTAFRKNVDLQTIQALVERLNFPLYQRGRRGITQIKSSGCGCAARIGYRGTVAGCHPTE